MNMISTLLIAIFTLFLTTGIAGAADLDDLDVSIHVVGQDDDIHEMGNELKLPDSVSESAREHADDARHNHDNHGDHNHGIEHGGDHTEHTQDGHEHDTDINDTSHENSDISTDTSSDISTDTSSDISTDTSSDISTDTSTETHTETDR
jgi:hypothetical protein